jgi:hypothetical protein
MPKLSRQHAQLTTVVRLVSDEVIQKVNDVSGKILPGGWWD